MGSPRTPVGASFSHVENDFPLKRWLLAVGLTMFAVIATTAYEEVAASGAAPRWAAAAGGGSKCWNNRQGFRRALRAVQECDWRNIDIEAVIRVAEKASQAVLEVYRSPEEDWQVHVKSDSSPITLADRKANRIIYKGLKELASDVPIISEESAQVPYSERKRHQHSWVVDPLDGTREFLKHSGEFTVNIALLKGSRPVIGVVVAPAQGKVYWAAQGRGAWVREASGEDRPLRAAEFSLQDEGLVVLGSAYEQVKAEYLDQLSKPVLKELGSSLKLLELAEGSAHIYPRLAPTNEWDIAAAQIILEEAGGKVLQAGGPNSPGRQDWQVALGEEKSLKYNKKRPLNPYFVAFGNLRGPTTFADAQQQLPDGGGAATAAAEQQGTEATARRDEALEQLQQAKARANRGKSLSQILLGSAFGI